MFYGNSSSITVYSIRKNFIRNLDGILQNDFHLTLSVDNLNNTKYKYIFDQSIWKFNGHFDD